jgi:E3 ubiquitin-protein ligase SHPRH
MVDIVGEALRANKIAFVKCTNRGKDFASSGALEGFRANASLRVLLMPLGLGAEGLDLIVASHVYLLEPLLNVHQEMQAVNRISRLGQARRTYVHKYVLQGTIEERITQVQRGESECKEKDAQGGGHHRPQQQRAKMHRDDDLLDEADLRFILNLPAAPLLGRDAVHHGAGSANGGAAQDSAAEGMLIGTC